MGRLTAIHARIFIPFMLALGIGTAAAWWLAANLFATNLQQQGENRLREAIRVLAQGNLPLTPDLLARLGRVLQADLYLITADGGVTGRTTMPRHRHFLAAVERAWHDRPGDAFSTISDIGGLGYGIIIQPLEKAVTGRYVAIAAVTDLAGLRAASRQMAWRLGLGALLGSLLLAWLVHRVACGITTPINRLSALAARIAAGDLQARVRVDSPRELQELAESLNRMAAQLQQYQAEIAEQNRLQALGEMAARIAHEIRNPLTAIKLQLQLLKESLEGDDIATTDALLDEVGRLELIVSSALQGANEQNIRLIPVDLNALTGEVLQLFQPQLAHRSIRLEAHLERQLPEIDLDPDRMKQVLVNLLVNAADALEPGDCIQVHTGFDPGSGQVILAVDDSGPGIPEAQRARLFSASMSDKPGGLGIGLRLSRQLVELQDGHIEVHDSPLGGARFLIRFSPGKVNP